MKKIIVINQLGDILSFVESNDPNLKEEQGTFFHEMENVDEWNRVRQKPWYFRITDKTIKEKSKEEKDREDEKRVLPVGNSSQKKIEDLETKLAVLREDIEKLKKK